MLLRTTNDDTKATGYYRVPFSGGAPEKIVMMDKAIGALTKAKNADVVVFTATQFDEFADYWADRHEVLVAEEDHECAIRSSPSTCGARPKTSSTSTATARS